MDTDTIEFFKRTDHRNFRYNIGYLVKQRLREYADNVQYRRQLLGEMLHFENLQYNEELAIMAMERIRESKRQRQELVKTQALEQRLAEEQLLKLKNIQRELENCEEWRHRQSEAALRETKQAQLYQIEAKRALIAREKEIDRMWLVALQRITEEKANQEAYEQQLRKTIASADQSNNAESDRQRKLQAKIDENIWKAELTADNLRVLKLDHLYGEEERRRERCKKIRQCEMLQEQISQNLEKMKIDKGVREIENTREEIEENQKILKDLNANAKAKIRNRVWHEKYLQHVREEQLMRQARDKALDDVLMGGGCVLQQRNKRPYGNQNR